MAIYEEEISSSAYITGIQRINSSAYIENTRKSLTSSAFISEPETSIVCDGEIVDDIMEEMGTLVTIRVVTKSFTDEYGDAEESYQDHRRRAMVQRYGARDQEVKEGVFKAGEIVFAFRKSDEDIVKPGNRIKYGNTWYEIRNIDQQPMMDVLYYLNARVQKV